jgi:hypothetical protein
MFIVDLACADGHEFEGWYGDQQEFLELKEQGELSCPLCGCEEVARVPSAPRISTSTTRGEKRTPETPAQVPAAPAPSAAPAAAAPPPTPPPVPMEVQKALSEVLQQVRASHEDVGEQFAERALAMHRGDEEHKPIHGHATPDEEDELVEEGVAFARLPIPDIEKN